MSTDQGYVGRARRAAVDAREMLRDFRRREIAAGRKIAAQRAGEDPLFPTGQHDRALDVFRNRLRVHRHLESDYDSRLCELVEYFGYEIAQKAPYCRPWIYWDDPRRARYVHDKLGLDEGTFGILHMYALFNRLDPAGSDMHYIYDGLVTGLDRMGPDVAVLDFGCGLGQNGLSFAAAGRETVMVDVVDSYLDFVRFCAELRGLHPVLVQAPAEDDFYDSAADGRRYGLIIEWSTFEHVPDTIGALQRVLGGLVPGGFFVTTTFCKDWTPEAIEHYRRDSADDAISDQYLSGEADAWLREQFDVHSPKRTIAKVLVKR
jgi:2-polyprenyl-3-methyl-5-hydroxy-6-metoxy-1,4-benzoquinol methylase